MKKLSIAGLVGLLFTTPILAADVQANDVVVTSSRFPSEQFLSPNIKIITKEDIENSASINLPDLLRNVTGVNVQSIYGNTGNDALIDLRGFGDAAGSNTLILLNGQRLNNPDLSNVVWPSIPVTAIQRIEILPGSGTVLYGDRATSGVINIITDKSGKDIKAAGVTFGSYGFKSTDGYVSGQLAEKGYYNAYLTAGNENGFRSNSSYESYAINGTLGVQDSEWDAYLDYGLFDTKNELPGSLIDSRYKDHEKTAYYLDTSVKSQNSQSKNGLRLRPGFTYQLNESLAFSNEMSFSVERQNSHYPDPDLYGDATDSGRNIYAFSLTPKLKHKSTLFGMQNKTIVGFDYYYGKFEGKSNGILSSSQNNNFTSGATQKSNALYFQNETKLSESFGIKFGYRTQKIDQYAEKSEFYYWGNLNPSVEGSIKHRQQAYDFMLLQRSENFSSYYSISKNFRISNLDELYGFENYVPVFYGNMLKPQTGLNNEIGASYTNVKQHFKASLYQNKIDNEIGWDNNQYMNVNFDKTVHRGLEFQYKQVISEKIANSLNLSLQQAKFIEGNYEGGRLPNVAEKILSNQLTFDNSQYGKYTVQLNCIGNRVFTNDLDNDKKKLPGYMTVDLKSSFKLFGNELNLIALNILDKKYSPTGLAGSTTYYYYPANGRTFYINMKHDF